MEQLPQSQNDFEKEIDKRIDLTEFSIKFHSTMIKALRIDLTIYKFAKKVYKDGIHTTKPE